MAQFVLTHMVEHNECVLVAANVALFLLSEI